jgi:adenylate kinase family enzyme
MRLDVYDRETDPLLNYYKAKKVPMIAHTADALEMPPEKVVEQIVKELKKLKLA